MFTRITINLTTIEREGLERLAARRYRPMKEQARLAIRRMLITQGELPSDKPILQPQAQAQGEQVS